MTTFSENDPFAKSVDGFMTPTHDTRDQDLYTVVFTTNNWEEIDNILLQHLNSNVYIQEKMVWQNRTFENILDETNHHQLQKARQDWLREEIVKLEGEKVKTEGAPADVRFAMEKHNQALQTIIDRYHFELDQDKK